MIKTPRNSFLTKNRFKLVSLLMLGGMTPIGTVFADHVSSYAETFYQQKVTGKVTSANGPVSGVTVSVQGNANVATSTDGEGNFAIMAKNGDILIFSALGYDAHKETVEGNVLQVVLKASGQSLEEVVVTGYSAQKKENISASVTTLDQAKLQDVRSPNISNLLQGKAPGINIVNGSGKPGAQANIRIRGRNSISSGTSPLWVVDRVVMHATPNVNPNDIESISILKDAAATAQYGARGTNGVLVVTTKKGNASGDKKVSFNLSTGITEFNQGKYRSMNSQQLWDMFQSFKSWDRKDNVTEDVLKTDFNWLDNATHTGKVNDLNVNYSGGSDNTLLYASANYYTEDGTVKGYKYDRMSARINLEHKLTDKITFKPKINAMYTSTDDRQHSIYDTYLNMPWDSPYRDGQLVNPVDENNTILWFGRDQRNYLYDLQYNYGEGQTLDLHTNLDFSYRISDLFTFESTNNLTFYNQTTMSYEDPKSNAGLSNKGSVSQSAAKRITRFFNQMLRYNQSFGKHNVEALAAYEYSDYMYTNVGAGGKGIAAGSKIIDNTADFLSKEGSKNDYAFQSGMVLGTYNYDDRYNFQASFRLDGSSRFGKDKQYGSFYAMSGSWNIHKESFFNVAAINLLRLRLSYGQVGNVPNDLYASYSQYELNGQYNGEPAAIQGLYRNLSVSWETSKDANIGVEARIFDRIDLGLDLYNKNTNGLLYKVLFPSTAGWTGYWENIGGIVNKGIEFSLDADILSKESDIQWNIAFNIAKNNNKIKELKDGLDIPSGNKRFSEGRDIDSWYMRRWAGVDPENGSPLWEVVDSQTGEKTTTSNYNDASLQFVGTSTPKYQGGFSTTLSYKDFSLNASFAYLKGAYAYHSAREYFDADGAYPFYNQMELQDGWSRWSTENRNATHPLADYNNNSGSNKTSSRYLEDVSFLRMRNVRLGYNFKKSLAERLRLKNLNIYVSADNLWNLTKFSGLDPENVLSAANASPGTTEEGDATSQYPSPKRITFGLNFTF